MQRSSRLGYHENSTFEVKKAQFQKGDRLFLYTDGLVECRNTESSEYGEPRLKKVIQKYARAGLPEMMQAVEDDFFLFANGEPLHDDVMVVVIDLNLGAEKKKELPEAA